MNRNMLPRKHIRDKPQSEQKKRTSHKLIAKPRRAYHKSTIPKHWSCFILRKQPNTTGQLTGKQPKGTRSSMQTLLHHAEKNWLQLQRENHCMPQAKPAKTKHAENCLACNTVGKVIFFMEVQYCVKQNLEFPENSFNWFPSIGENSFVSFLPNQIHKNSKRYSSHSRLQDFFVVL